MSCSEIGHRKNGVTSISWFICVWLKKQKNCLDFEMLLLFGG